MALAGIATPAPLDTAPAPAGGLDLRALCLMGLRAWWVVPVVVPVAVVPVAVVPVAVVPGLDAVWARLGTAPTVMASGQAEIINILRQPPKLNILMPCSILLACVRPTVRHRQPFLRRDDLIRLFQLPSLLLHKTTALIEVRQICDS